MLYYKQINKDVAFSKKVKVDNLAVFEHFSADIAKQLKKRLGDRMVSVVKDFYKGLPVEPIDIHLKQALSTSEEDAVSFEFTKEEQEKFLLEVSIFEDGTLVTYYRDEHEWLGIHSYWKETEWGELYKYIKEVTQG